MKLLPINSEENLKHIYSKIGLSLTLSKAGITTPDFIVANGLDEVKEAAQKLQYPVMIKTNSDSGGVGVFECNDVADINKINSSFFNSPLLVQKKIIGTELDLYGLYRDGKLIYFTYSQIKKVAKNKFGPSKLRLYKQLSVVDKEIFIEMKNLGKALGANGFVTISCIEANNKRYFFEADMRPNV
ncbi:MAG: ATP-grasp domain-containing protein [Rickettsiales bacterium]|nr:ATP-grasp domain-containing protein [Rickettsiales bacterium]